MKKPVLILLLVITTITASNAQFTKAGGGLTFSSGFYFNDLEFPDYRSGHFGAFIKGIYEINMNIHISPSYTIFYPNITKDPGYRSSISSMMFDLNGHYVFNSLDRFEFYGLLGFDILLTRSKTKSSELNEVLKERDNALGLNIGAGTYMKLTEQIDLCGEAKYILSRYGQFMVNAGILINLDWLIKHEKPEK